MKIIDNRTTHSLTLGQIAIGTVFRVPYESRTFMVVDSHPGFNYNFQTRRAIVRLDVGKLELADVDTPVEVLDVELHIK